MANIYIDNKIVYKYRNNQLYNETINNLNSLHNDKFIETRKKLECKEQGECHSKIFKPASKIKETFAKCIGNKEEYYKYKKGNLLDENYKDYFKR